MLKDLQPGRDGGVPKRRASQAAYDKAGLAATTPSVRDRVVEECMCAFHCKASSKSAMCEAKFDLIIQGKATTLARCSGAEDRAVGVLLPKSFKAVLALEGEGVMRGFMGEGEKIQTSAVVSVLDK